MENIFNPMDTERFKDCSNVPRSETLQNYIDGNPIKMKMKDDLVNNFYQYLLKIGGWDLTRSEGSLIDGYFYVQRIIRK